MSLVQNWVIGPLVEVPVLIGPVNVSHNFHRVCVSSARIGVADVNPA